MLATSAHAVELWMVFSQSLARRRQRPSQAKVRSTLPWTTLREFRLAICSCAS